MTKVLSKFMDSYFVLSDNSLDKQLTSYFLEKEFSQQKKIQILQRDLIVFYALAFKSGNMKKTIQTLEHNNTQPQPTKFSISCGISFILTLFLACVTLLPTSKVNWSFPTILVYFTLIFACYSVFAIASTVDFWHRYNVNY